MGGQRKITKVTLPTTYLLAKIPDGALESSIIMNDAEKNQRRSSWIKDGKDLIITNVGAEVSEFWQVGDNVMVRGNVPLTELEINGEMLYLILERDLCLKVEVEEKVQAETK